LAVLTLLENTERFVKPTVLILSNSPLHRDPRVQRQINALNDDFNVVVAGTSDPGRPVADFIPIVTPKRTLLAKIRSAVLLASLRRRIAGNLNPENRYWSWKWIRALQEKLQSVKFDVVLANDCDMLPLAVKVSNGRPVIFDAHEYAAGQFEESSPKIKRHLALQKLLLSKYTPQATSMMTVCEGIAELYQADTGVRAETVMNLPNFENLAPGTVQPDRIRLIHHGIAGRPRQLELMVDMLDHLDPCYHLTFMLVDGSPQKEDLNWLKNYAKGNDRVDFLEPVPTLDIAKTINSYDIGVFMLPPKTTNQQLALPNKFFEFIQARLAIAIGPSPEMAKILREHNLGVVSEEFTPQSLAAELSRLTLERIQSYKQNAHEVAEQYCSARVEDQIRKMVLRALSNERMALRRVA